MSLQTDRPLRMHLVERSPGGDGNEPTSASPAPVQRAQLAPFSEAEEEIV